MDSYSIWMVILVSCVMCLHSCMAQTDATELATDMEVTTLCCDEAVSTEADEATDVAKVVTSQTAQDSGRNQTVQSVSPSQTAHTTTPSDPEGEPEGKATTEKSGSCVTSPYMYWPVVSFVTLIVMTVV